MKLDVKIIAVDFDGTLCENKWPAIGEANTDLISYLKKEKKDGSRIVLWTCRSGRKLMDAINWCIDQGLEFDEINENVREVVDIFGTGGNKIYADIYIDDKASSHFQLPFVKDYSQFSDGYHTFDELYTQRRVLFSVLCKVFKDESWKSKRHSDGTLCFEGEWFIVGIDTPKGVYTYHYHMDYWNEFDCQELPLGKEWDGHTAEDVHRLLSLCDKPEPSSITWAKSEISRAIQHENPDRKPGEFDYGCACYDSALKAYTALMSDGHSGFSIGLTKNILNRLIDHQALVPITDETPLIINAEEWEYSPTGSSDEFMYQNNRQYSLFKYISKTGEVRYKDVGRSYGVDLNRPESGAFTSGLVSRIIDELYPIELPYYNPSDRYKVVCEGFLSDKKNGDYDTVRIVYLVTPEQERVEVDRYFKETEEGWVEIDTSEYLERLHMSVKIEVDMEEYKNSILTGLDFKSSDILEVL